MAETDGVCDGVADTDGVAETDGVCDGVADTDGVADGVNDGVLDGEDKAVVAAMVIVLCSPMSSVISARPQ